MIHDDELPSFGTFAISCRINSFITDKLPSGGTFMINNRLFFQPERLRGALYKRVGVRFFIQFNHETMLTLPGKYFPTKLYIFIYVFKIIPSLIKEIVFSLFPHVL